MEPLLRTTALDELKANLEVISKKLMNKALLMIKGKLSI